MPRWAASARLTSEELSTFACGMGIHGLSERLLPVLQGSLDNKRRGRMAPIRQGKP